MTCPAPKSARYTMTARNGLTGYIDSSPASCTIQIQKQPSPLLSFLRWKYSTASSEMIMAFFASPWQCSGTVGSFAPQLQLLAPHQTPQALQMNAWVKQSNALEVHPEPSKSTSLKSSKASYEQKGNPTQQTIRGSTRTAHWQLQLSTHQHIAKNLEVTAEIVRSSAYGIASRPIFRVR